ncbi:methyl-accepting chemotaxis protein [Desulfovibrio sp. TomC]|uniref:methyl-accepting chemotaxis protein n=1 Tax=Desulfovibrio sp. TomC TaxID=1562888 RepID=UPI0005BE599A|nr:methyl-accepting chemotaxis protein [Desulfovibrio sp. TomC]
MRSIKLRIMLQLILVISIPTTIVLGIIFNTIYDDTVSLHVAAIQKEIRQLENAMVIFTDQAKQNVAQLAADPLLPKVDATLTSYVATTQKPKSVPRADDLLGQEITALFSRVQATHPAYVEVFFGSGDGGFLSSVAGELPAGYDPRKRPWYQEAMQTPDRPIISKAYMSTTGEAVVSVTKVVTDKGRPLGAIGVDISLGVLTKIVKDIRIAKTGYVVFVQGDGVVISDPKNDKYNFKKIGDLGVPALEAAFASPDGSKLVEMDGRRFLALTSTATGLGWKFLTFVEYDELVGPMQSLMWKSALGFAAILAAICGVISFFLNADVFRPLGRMINHLKEIGSGNYQSRLAVRRRDEVGQVYEALNQTSATLLAHVGEIEAKSAEAEHKAAQAEEAAKRAEAATTRAEAARVEGMLHAAERLTGVVDIVTTASSELSTQIGESTQGAEHQSGRINETATAVEQMTASVLEIARNAEGTARLAEQSKAAAEDGGRQMEQVKADVHGISLEFEDVYGSVSDLSYKADGIGSIAQTIEDIADQTNLLALNAAIEAARAGDAGRGFAVVADEVRKLAEKTMTATKEVGEAVAGIRRSVGGTLTGMDRAKQIIEQSMARTDQAAHGLANLLAMFAQSSDQIRAIATAAEEQSSATEEINRHIEEINGIASETVGAMREAARAVADLAEQAVVLKDLICALESERPASRQLPA